MERQSTTFILMKILRDLNFNTNTETREQQRRFVNERFQRSNTNIERSIKSSTTDLTELISNFSDIYTSIEQSKNRVENVRERLRECKNLLLLKRQDIRKLWLLTSEQNALVRIYQNVDELKHVPKRLQFYLSKRLYLHASLLLLKAKEHPELRLINALSEIDLQIKEERLTLEDQLRIQLIDQLFDKPCRDVLGHKNSSITTTNSFNKTDQNSLSRTRENRLLRKQLDQDFEEGKLSFESNFLPLIPDKYMLVDIRQSSELYIDALLQSLSLLSHLNETLDFVQKQLPAQFYRIIIHTTQHIIDNNFILSNSSQQNHMVNNPDCLRDLLETCYEQFKLVVKNIEYVLNTLKLLQEHQAPLQIQQREYLQSLKQTDSHFDHQRSSLRNEVQFEIPYLFSIELVWETLQQILSDVLNEYIDYNNTLESASPTTSLTSSTTDYTNRPSLIDFSQYLTKKAPPRSQHIPRLFEFCQSAQFNSMTSYLQEQNRFVIKQDTSTTKTPTTSYKQYVCKPNYRNVTAVHDVLRRIIDDIDNNYQLHPTKRILDRKLTDFIRDRFIGRVIKDIREFAQLSSYSSTIPDQNRLIELIPLVLQKQLQLPIPILQSTYLIFKSCEELCALVKCLPPYADDFCQAIVDLLFKHRESCYKLFLSIVEKSDSSGVSIYSNEWVKDPDINRHLRTMPAFDAFVRKTKQQQNNDNDDDNVENIRFRQTKETETLLINFSQNEMNPDDICTNYKHIKVLATIHESLDWLYYKLVHYFDILDKCLTDTKYLDALTQTTVTSGFTSRSIKQNTSQYDQLKLSRLNLEIFSNAMKTTLTLSDDILLVLFLEIRLHCFYHLSSLFRNSLQYSYSIDTDPDENIMSLNRDLTQLQETLSSSLSEKNFSFLFQGLGFVLSTILIRSLSRFNRISELGVTKMCRNIFAIEQTLAQIRTVGDAELMRAHQYYELLYSTKPEEILDIIEERGIEYSEQDYLNLLQLQHRSFSSNERGNFDLNKYEQLIKNALRPKTK